LIYSNMEVIHVTQNLSQEDKILYATIQCLEENGIQGTTIRKIAEAAQVNSAAISYYYRSKDILVEKAMETALNNAFDFDNFPPFTEQTPREWLTDVFLFMVEGSIKYPGLTRAFFYDMIAAGARNTPMGKRLNDFMEQLLVQLMPIIRMDEDQLRKSLVQVASASFLVPVILPHVFDDFYPDMPKNTNAWRQFIYSMVDRHISWI